MTGESKRKAGCIFCQIVDGEAASFGVCEDELTKTFMDLFPVAAGHTLIITKDHYTNIFEATPEALAAVAATSVGVARAIRSEFSPDGLGVFQLNGAAAGQTIFHYHQHLIPRNEGEGLQLHSRIQGDAAELEAIAERLRGALERQTLD